MAAEASYAHTVGARLRALRHQAGLSLHGVQARSRGRLKAVVLGAYERGDRGLSIARLAEIAEFYGVPVAELLPESPVPEFAEPTGSANGGADPRLTIDLQRMADLPPQQIGPLARYAAAIQSQRADISGELLTIRARDLQTLAILYDLQPESLRLQLAGWGVLRKHPKRAAATRHAGNREQEPKPAVGGNPDGNAAI